MPPENEELDLRSALEAAYGEESETPVSSQEVGGSEEDTPEPIRDPAPTETSEPTPVEAEKTSEEPEPIKPRSPIERAPESWKPDVKAHWDKVPNEVRQEIYRRERDITETLQKTASERKLAHEFQQTVYPFEVFMRAENVNPLQAVRELLGQAALLRVGSPGQKAQLVANVVKQFNVPIKDLDAALVGEQIPDEESKLTRIIQQQLAPVNQFMQQVGSLQQQREQRTQSEMDQEIEQFASNPDHKYFYEVNSDMADILELAARQNRSMSLKDAYDRACKINDSVQAMITGEKQAENARKRAASASLPSRGAPVSSGQRTGDSIRDDLLNAMGQLAPD